MTGFRPSPAARSGRRSRRSGGLVALCCCGLAGTASVRISAGVPAPAAPESQASGAPGDLLRIAGELPLLRSQAGDADRAAAALIALGDALRALDGRRGPSGELPEMEAELYLRALEYRARAHLTRGEEPEAAEDFRAILLADPGWNLDVADLTPAAVDRFESQRGELVAYLTVATEPPGGTVFVGDEAVGETPLTARPVFAGEHRVRVERPGYRPVEAPPVDLLPGEVVSLEWELERTGPVLSVITSPSGATVRVGGRVAGVTAGDLPESLRALAPPRFAEEEFSAPLMVGGLTLGPHEITLEASCRRPARFVFHADEPRDYLPRFIRLRPSTGGLRIESEPSGGRVLLDGEDRGVAPLSFSAMCSGEHRVEILHPAGRCARSVSVTRGSRTAVRCALRPVVSLAPGESGAEEARAAVRRTLEASEEFFFLAEAEGYRPGDRDRGEAGRSGGGNDADGAPGTDGAGVQARVRVVAPPPGGGDARVEFLAAGARRPDAAVFDRFAPESAADALRVLLRRPERRRPWIGLTVAVRRSREEGGSGRVLEAAAVRPDGPAGLAGIEPGDLVRTAGGEPVFDELGFAEQLARHEPGSAFDILVVRDGAERPLRLVVRATPVLPPRPGAGCNRRLTDLAAGFARGEDDPLDRLEAGVCRLLLGDAAGALSSELADLALPPGPGIGQGTVHYYRGLALEAVGERARAADAFDAAAAVAGATLLTHDGPLLAPVARRRAGLLR